MNFWKTISRRLVLDMGRFLKVESHTIQLPNGEVIEDWAWIDTPNYINIAVETADGYWLCFRQPKYGVAGLSLAPVGGYIELGEDPLVAAQRELREETGYEAPDWTSLGTYTVDGNRGAGIAHLFLARGAVKVTEPYADDLEPQEILLLSRDEVVRAVAGGEFKVLGWVAVMALGLLA